MAAKLSGQAYNPRKQNNLSGILAHLIMLTNSD